jgi:hypothetical protein
MCGKAEEVHHNDTPQHSATCYKTLVHLHLLFPAYLLPVLTALASWLLGTPTQFFVLLISQTQSLRIAQSGSSQLAAESRRPLRSQRCKC